MKRIVVVLLGLVLLLVLLPVTGSCWIGDERLREIDQRILETERRLLDLNENQILNRIDWANWGIDLLDKDIKVMEKEIREKRKEWEELRKTDMDSEAAWDEWEKAGWELDQLDRKKMRIERTLVKLKRLRYRLEERSREIKREFGPRPFKLGLSIGSLNSDGSTQIAELKLRISKIDFFYGSDGIEEEENENIERLSYFGVESSLIKFQYSQSFRLNFPIGIEKFSNKEGIRVCAGLMIEGEWGNAVGRSTTGFGQIRIGLGENSVVTFLIGLFF